MAGAYFGWTCEMPGLSKPVEHAEEENELVEAAEDDDINVFNDETFGCEDTLEFDLEEQNRQFEHVLEKSINDDAQVCASHQSTLTVEPPRTVLTPDAAPDNDDGFTKLLKMLQKSAKSVPENGDGIPKLSQSMPQALTLEEIERSPAQPEHASYRPPSPALPIPGALVNRMLTPAGIRTMQVHSLPGGSPPFLFTSPPPPPHIRLNYPPPALGVTSPVGALRAGAMQPLPGGDELKRFLESLPHNIGHIGTPPHTRVPRHPLDGLLPPIFSTASPLNQYSNGADPHHPRPNNQYREQWRQEADNVHDNRQQQHGRRGGYQGNNYQSRNEHYQQQQHYRNRRYSEGPDYDSEENSGGEDKANKDPDAGLMTKREKDWIIRIQLMQLQTDNPYIDDYYYTVFHIKKLESERSERGDERPELSLVLPQLEGRLDKEAYQPVQFSNALGRLTAASVHNPRKIIDVHVEHGCEEVKGREGKKYKELMLEIEHAYDVLLMVDDMSKRALALPPEAREPLYKERQDGLTGLVASLQLGAEGREKFRQLVQVPKGLKLVLRMVQLLPQAVRFPVQEALLSVTDLLQTSRRLLTTPSTLQLAAKTLLTTLPATPSLSPLLGYSGALVQGTGQAAVVLRGAYGSGLVWALLQMGEMAYCKVTDIDADDQNKWKDFVAVIADAMSAHSSVIMPPHTEVQAKILLTHFERVLDHGVFLQIESTLEKWCTDV